MMLSAAAGSSYSGFGNAGVVNGYQVLAARNDGSLIAEDAHNNLLLLHPDGTLEGKYTGKIPVIVSHQNIQADGKYLVLSNGVLTRYYSNGTIDKSFGTNGTVSNFYVQQSGVSSQVFHVEEDAVDGFQIFVTGFEMYQTTGGNNETALFVERLTPHGALDTTFGKGGVANPSPLTYSTNYIQSFFTEIGPDHNIYVADDVDSDPIVNRYSENGTYQGQLYSYGQTEGETVAGLAFQHDGKILVLTKSYSTGASLSRYNANLSVDTSFGNSGQVLVAPPTTMDNPVVDNTPTTVFVRPDGIIFTSGVFDLAGAGGPNPPVFSSLAYNSGLIANPSAISGHVYHDINGNGKRDANDPPLRYYSVYIDLNHDGKWELGEPIAYTDYNGYYKIDGLSPGTYTLREAPGLTLTQPAASAGGDYKIVLGKNQLVGLRDFGNR